MKKSKRQHQEEKMGLLLETLRYAQNESQPTYSEKWCRHMLAQLADGILMSKEDMIKANYIWKKHYHPDVDYIVDEKFPA